MTHLYITGGTDINPPYSRTDDICGRIWDKLPMPAREILMQRNGNGHLVFDCEGIMPVIIKSNVTLYEANLIAQELALAMGCNEVFVKTSGTATYWEWQDKREGKGVENG